VEDPDVGGQGGSAGEACCVTSVPLRTYQQVQAAVKDR